MSSIASATSDAAANEVIYARSTTPIIADIRNHYGTKTRSSWKIKNMKHFKLSNETEMTKYNYSNHR